MAKKRRTGLSAALEALRKKFEAQKAKIVKRGIRPLLNRAKSLKADLEYVEAQIADYMGTSSAPAPKRAKGAPKATKGKRRKRLTPEQKMNTAKAVYSYLSSAKNKGEKFGQKALTDFSSPLLMREIQPLWNKANPDKKISKSGDKATTVYFVA